TYGARGEDGLASRFGEKRSFRDELDALRGAAVHAHLGDVCIGEHREVRPMPYRPQEGVGRAPAPAALLVHLEVGAAEVVAVVEHFHRRDAAFGGSGSPGVDDVPAHARILDAHLAARAITVGWTAFVVLERPKNRQDVVPRPAAVAERGPVVPVLLLPP